MLFNRLWIILVLIVILIISVVYRESFVSSEESILEEGISNDIKTSVINPDKYMILDDSLDYLNNYSSDLNGYSNKVHNISKNYLRNRKPNKIKSNSKLTPTTPFETLNYNKALLSAVQLQNFEDRYLYKVNEKLNY